MGYITEQGEKNIKAFTYRGGNLSLSYKYLWSPLAEKLMQFTPTTIAPNTMTLFGFLLHTVATVILCLQGPFDSDAPRWSLVLYGVSVFLYQTLDNMDGKQARRLKNSTPLGMIMDHGCDALGVICLTAGMGRVVCMNEPSLFLWTFIFVVFSFYLSAWCQYWSNGIMVLGKFNGVDDGIPIIWFCAIVTSIVGQSVWRTPLTIFGETVLLNRIVAILILLTSIPQIYSIATQNKQEFTKDVKRAIKDLGHAALVMITLVALTFKADFTHQYIVGISIALAFVMSRTVSYTLVCSVALMEFKQFSSSVLTFSLGYLSYIFLFRSLIPPWVVVYGIVGFSVIEYFYFVTDVCRHIARILNIPIFGVFKPEEVKK